MNKSQDEIWSLFDKRDSLRSFSNEVVEEGTVQFLLQCAVTAPSNGNMQPWEFIVIRNDSVKQKIVECTFMGYFSKGGNHQEWIKDASVIIVACANQKRTKARYGEAGIIGSIIDVSAAVQNLLVAVAGLGLATCWVGGFDEEKLKEVLEIPSHVKPIGVLPIGFPKDSHERKNRLPQ